MTHSKSKFLYHTAKNSRISYLRRIFNHTKEAAIQNESEDVSKQNKFQIYVQR